MYACVCYYIYLLRPTKYNNDMYIHIYYIMSIDLHYDRVCRYHIATHSNILMNVIYNILFSFNINDEYNKLNKI